MTNRSIQRHPPLQQSGIILPSTRIRGNTHIPLTATAHRTHTAQSTISTCTAICETITWRVAVNAETCVVGDGGADAGPATAAGREGVAGPKVEARVEGAGAIGTLSSWALLISQNRAM